jgi:hypothetical protein
MTRYHLPNVRILRHALRQRLQPRRAPEPEPMPEPLGLPLQCPPCQSDLPAWADWCTGCGFYVPTVAEAAALITSPTSRALAGPSARLLFLMPR